MFFSYSENNDEFQDLEVFFDLKFIDISFLNYSFYLKGTSYVDCSHDWTSVRSLSPFK
jgi:hypothetical protein